MTAEQKRAQIAEVVKNRSLIEAEKKNTLKKADVVFYQYAPDTPTSAAKSFVNKAVNDPDTLMVRLVINTTNVIDSHNDCHISGLWDKTLQETKEFFLLQEHVMAFDSIIADSVNDNLKATAETFTWSELGYSFAGTTQALMFEGTINRKRNPFMFKQYSNGYVLNHSVGMRYVKLVLCVNLEDEEYKDEKTNWDKYYSSVANKEVADERGYFWAVLEAKMVEGSAVVRGSNAFTPTLEVQGANNKAEAAPSTSTDKSEPSGDTPKTNISNFLT